MDNRDRWQEDDAAALEERLASLRQWSRDITEAVAAIPDPESYLDGERAARAVTNADRMLARLPSGQDDDNEPDETPPQPPHPTRSPHRLALRATADRVLAAIQALPKPTTFIEADRAARCALASERMLLQLYTDPKPGKAKQTFVDDPDDDDPDFDRRRRYPDPHAELLRRLDRLTRGFVRIDCGGVWPDGTAYDSDTPTDDKLFLHSDLATFRRAEADVRQSGIAGDTVAGRWFVYAVSGRVNIIARAHAERTGKWPNGKTYVTGEPDIYFPSRTLEDVAIRKLKNVPRAEDETSVPGFPWWMVSKTLYDSG